MNNQEFRMQGLYDLATHTIFEKDYKLSKKCLIFMKHGYNVDIRFEFYNRLSQILESTSVRNLVGSHIGARLSNPKNDKKMEF